MWWQSPTITWTTLDLKVSTLQQLCWRTQGSNILELVTESGTRLRWFHWLIDEKPSAGSGTREFWDLGARSTKTLVNKFTQEPPNNELLLLVLLPKLPPAHCLSFNKHLAFSDICSMFYSSIQEPLIVEAKGLRIGFLGYCDIPSANKNCTEMRMLFTAGPAAYRDEIATRDVDNLKKVWQINASVSYNQFYCDEGFPSNQSWYTVQSSLRKKIDWTSAAH